MKNPILREALNAISEDPKIIRLATITTFIHSLLFIWYLIYLIVSLSTTNRWWILWLIWDLGDIVMPSWWVLVALIVLWVILLIWYSLLPPIWDAAMIFYVSDREKWWTASLWSGITRFFPMFEFNATLSLLNLVTWWILATRLYVLDVLNLLTIALLIMRFLVILLAMFFLPYTKFIITLDDTKYFEAMKQSMVLTLRNMWITFKFVLINLFLYVRFIINIAIVIGIPIWLIYLASKLDFADSWWFQTVVIIISIALVALTAYINGIIEAFFISYRWRVYEKVKE